MRYFWFPFDNELIETDDARYILRLLMSGYIEISKEKFERLSELANQERSV